MPALSDADLRGLRERLDAREAELREQMRALEAERSEAPRRNPHDQVEDLGEQGEQRIREAVRDAEDERDFAEWREVVAARDRITAGRYGVCIACGEDIPPARLHAQPWAARCVACQQAFEQTHPVGVFIPPIP